MSTYNFKIMKAKDLKRQFMVERVFINCEMSKITFQRFQNEFDVIELTEEDINTYLMAKEVRDISHMTSKKD